MNAIEQAFSASINTMDPDQVNASLGSQERWPIHKDKTLCSYIMSTVQAPEGSLSIKESTLPEAGSGLFINRDLAEGELIFTSVPLVLCAEVGSHMEACDFCFQQRRRVFHPVEDRFLQPGEVLPPLLICNGCRMYQYCSKVSTMSFARACSLSSSSSLTCFCVVLLATSLGYGPFIRMQLACGRVNRRRDENTIPSLDSDAKESLVGAAGKSPGQAGARGGQLGEARQENLAEGP